MQKKAFDYQISVQSDDLRVVHAMRGIAAHIMPRDSWGGTGKDNWERDGHVVTFKFRYSNQRDTFIRDLHEILKPNTFSLVIG